MASSIEDFVKRLVKTSKAFSFVFTDDFFMMRGQGGFNVDKYRDIRNIVQAFGPQTGSDVEERCNVASKFDVEVLVIRKNFQYITTTFEELAEVPFSSEASIFGFGEDMVNAEKADFLVEMFFTEKAEMDSAPISNIMQAKKDRQLVLVVERQGDLRRPSLEPIRKLRHKLSTILVSPDKGPIVDCQVRKFYEPGNSNSLSTLMNTFCIEYGAALFGRPNR
ncbi:MAG: hypothetical protein ACRC46_11435 [Thermoguttaceae bacterium]